MALKFVLIGLAVVATMLLELAADVHLLRWTHREVMTYGGIVVAALTIWLAFPSRRM
jgi:hypothetical protein